MLKIYKKISIICALLTFMALSGCSQHSLQSPYGYHNDQPMSQNIYNKIAQYEQLTYEPWPSIEPSETPLYLGAKEPAIAMIRHRLYLLGDYQNTDQDHASDGDEDNNYHITSNNRDYFDRDMHTALKHFQMRHGIRQTGAINRTTLKALNVLPETRVKQLYASMERWGKLPTGIGSHYIQVNIPTFTLNVVKDGQKTLNMRVVAGKSSRPTPELFSWVESITFNPKWNVPKSISEEDIIPKIMDNPKYLSENNIKIYRSWRKDKPPVDPATINWNEVWEKGFKYHFTQGSGNLNALGRIKFIFKNKKSIYMHDTPDKSLFKLMRRAYSSGCIRLEKPLELVQYVLQNQPEHSIESITETLHSKKTKTIRIKNPLPLYVTYITSWVDASGRVHFREDIYAHKNDTTHAPTNYISPVHQLQ